MANKQVLTDAEKGVWLERFESAAPDDTPAEKRWALGKRTLHGGLSDGVDLVEVDNGALSFAVVPTRGLGLLRAQYRGISLGWKAPVRGPVHPKFVNLAERSGLGWLQGFDEFMVRCGLDSNGAPCRDLVRDDQGNELEMPLTLHGRIANQPAYRVEVEVEEGEPPVLSVSGAVEESMMLAPALGLSTRLSTAVGSNVLRVADEVHNLGGVEAEMQLLYHWNFGPPLLEAGARLVVPLKKAAPRDARAAEETGDILTYLGPTAGYTEQVYYYELAGDGNGRTFAMLRNRAGDRAAVLRFNKTELPCFTQWKNTAAESDGYVTGLEPATNYPNPKPFERERGRVVKLPPGGVYRTETVLEVLDTAAAVRAVEKEAAALTADAPAEIHRVPVGEFSDI